MDVVLYLRFSSDRQTEQSIEGQRRVCREFCERQGYNIIDEYVDRALSASKDVEKRVRFQQMITDSADKRFNAVVVYKLDRFARQRKDSAVYKSKLLKNGVKVISATENISNTPEGIILESVLEGMAEFYSAELSQKVTRGMRESALKCNSTGGQLPLGFKIENKKYVIDEAEAELVRKAFKMYSEGNTVVEICDYFNNLGYRTKKGALFNKNSFSRMLSNEKYIGTYRYKDIVIENGLPAIISKKLFNEVQNIKSANKKAPARTKSKDEYILTTKLFCGHCGSYMVGESTKKPNGNIYRYYSCADRKHGNGCTKKSVRKDWIEDIVAKDCMELLTPEIILQIAKEAVAENKRQLSSKSPFQALQDDLKTTNKKILNLVKLAEQGINSPTIAQRLDELEQEKKVIEQRLAELQKKHIVLTEELVVDYLSQFLIGNIEDDNFRKDLIKLLVNSVTLYDEGDHFRFDYLFNLTENERQSFTVPKSSYLASQCSPLKTNPNIVFIGLVFGYTKNHRQG